METSLRFTTSRGEEFEGHVVQLGRYEVVFDLFAPEESLRTSEVLPKFNLTLRERPLYEGKATTSDLVNHGNRVTCKALLGDPGLNERVRRCPISAC